MRQACKARKRGVLALYAAGSGTQWAGMQRQLNARVFMKWVLKYRPFKHSTQHVWLSLRKSVLLSLLRFVELPESDGE